MIRTTSRLAIVALTIISLLHSPVNAQGDSKPVPFDCEKITVDGANYDISALKANTYNVQGEPIDARPSKIRYDYIINPCQAIVIPEGKTDSNCKDGTWVCQDVKLIVADKDPSTIFLNTIAGSAEATKDTPAREVSPSVARAEKLENVKELPWNLTLKGGNINGQDQSAVISFICDLSVTDPKANPTLSKYENGVAYFSWKSSFACPLQQPPPSSEGMSGFGVFLTVVGVLGLVYVALGALYNHKVYGATGMDLLPNIDFWKDFPSLVVDVVRHVWDSVTGRVRGSHGGGYTSV